MVVCCIATASLEVRGVVRTAKLAGKIDRAFISRYSYPSRPNSLTSKIHKTCVPLYFLWIHILQFSVFFIVLMRNSAWITGPHSGGVGQMESNRRRNLGKSNRPGKEQEGCESLCQSPSPHRERFRWWFRWFPVSSLYPILISIE